MRRLLREPWSTVGIAATLALGLGAVTAIYAVFNHVLFRPIPGVHGEASLVTVQFMLSKDADVAAQEVRDKVNRVIPLLPRTMSGSPRCWRNAARAWDTAGSLTPSAVAAVRSSPSPENTLNVLFAPR